MKNEKEYMYEHSNLCNWISCLTQRKAGGDILSSGLVTMFDGN